MRTITLTDGQIAKLKSALTETRDTDGDFDIDVVIDHLLTVNVQGWLETDGYTEDDYYRGTGAWVETYRTAQVTLTAIVFNIESCDNETCNVDERTEREIEKYLNAA